MRSTVFICSLFIGLNLYGQEGHLVLTRVKTDQPRNTMLSFMSAMEDYRLGRQNKDKNLLARIDDAVRTLNLEDFPRLLQKEKGREAAIFLKEVIDRISVIDYDRIPDQITTPNGPLLRWRLQDTEITISRVEQGERSGDYLFSKDTVFRAGEFYEKVKQLPYLAKAGRGAGYEAPWYDERIPDWARASWISIALWQWMGLLLFLLAGFFVQWIVRHVFSRLFYRAVRSRVLWDEGLIDSLRSPVALLFACGVWYSGIKLSQLHGNSLVFFLFLLRLTLSFALIWLVYNLMDVLATHWIDSDRKAKRIVDDHLLQMLRKVLKAVVALLGVLVVLQNLGVNVFSLLAGLGIGGLAVALAAKDAVANFFGALMILVDRPFQVGEWIIVGGAEGTVEEIGFRSTRIRTFYNSIISVANSELMNAKIDNMGRRHHRRIKTSLRINLKTPPDQVSAFVAEIGKIIKGFPRVVQENVQVAFYEFGVDYLEVLIVFFLDVQDGVQELSDRQTIFLQIIRLANEMNIEFAVPTRAVVAQSAQPSTESIFTR